MKGLAEFVMRGRLQAAVVAFATSGNFLFCWIGAAVLALVTLRKGAGEGARVLLWAALPAGIVAFVIGDTGPLTLLLATLLMALVLRNTVSLPLTLLASTGLAAAIGVALMAFAGSYLDQLVAAFDQFLAAMEQQYLQGGQQEITLPRPEPVQIAGLMGTGTAAASVLCLLLGRYWQAALYNPGGFGDEFRALRYPVGVAMALVIAGLGLSSLGLVYRTWAMMCFIPLSFAGLALVHARAQARGQGSGWLAVFYIAWVVFDPVKLVVVMFAIADSFLNFRQRWGAGPSGRDLMAPDDERPGRNDSDPDRDEQDRQ